ncbi:hypothetical protein Cgig2_024027 [Carnegiea gigantea]|uniref:Uncharacterized protein n=1 Tax=Carnegiea gigantea TaxID=171969 RepID=A0A9Q1QJ20_9CARY|nr:hypothetical protein Cgig2_024027 [Carnegiea gigantea]
MVFPRTLNVDEMALYILENFEWYWREVVFPPLPFPYDYKDLCLDFDLATAEGAARDFLLPKMAQVVFLEMLLNDAVKLGVLRRWMIDIMESALKELRWSTFEEWLWCNRDNILRAHRLEIDSNQEEDLESSNGSPLPSDDSNEIASPFQGAKSVAFRPSSRTLGPEDPFRSPWGEDRPLSRASTLLTLFGSFKDSGHPLGRSIELLAPWWLGPSERPMGYAIGSPAPCRGHKYSEEITNVRVPHIRG